MVHSVTVTFYVLQENMVPFFFITGPLAEVNLPIDQVLRQSKGFATVTFMMPEHAVKAYTELDGTAFCGRMLHLLPAKTEKVDDDDDGTSLCCVNYSTNMGHDDLNALNYNNISTSSEKKEFFKFQNST